MRTTIDIDDPLLSELKRLQRREGKSLGRLVSDLLARALREPDNLSTPPPPVEWVTRSMGARIDLADRDAVYGAMERHDLPAGSGDR